MLTANKVPIGPSHKPSIATNLESPFPRASFLKKSFAKYLKDSKIKNEAKEVLRPLISKQKFIFPLSNKLMNISPKTPVINPKFIKPWGIQKLSISINAIQIKRERNTQLKNKFRMKLEFER